MSDLIILFALAGMLSAGGCICSFLAYVLELPEIYGRKNSPLQAVTELCGISLMTAAVFAQSLFWYRFTPIPQAVVESTGISVLWLSILVGLMSLASGCTVFIGCKSSGPKLLDQVVKVLPVELHAENL